jgi:hypothetical protein
MNSDFEARNCEARTSTFLQKLHLFFALQTMCDGYVQVQLQMAAWRTQWSEVLGLHYICWYIYSYTHFSIRVCVCVLFCRLMDGVLRFSLTPSHTHHIGMASNFFTYCCINLNSLQHRSVCLFVVLQVVKIDSGGRIALQHIDLDAI